MRVCPRITIREGTCDIYSPKAFDIWPWMEHSSRAPLPHQHGVVSGASSWRVWLEDSLMRRGPCRRAIHDATKILSTNIFGGWWMAGKFASFQTSNVLKSNVCKAFWYKTQYWFGKHPTTSNTSCGSAICCKYTQILPSYHHQSAVTGSGQHGARRVILDVNDAHIGFRDASDFETFYTQMITKQVQTSPCVNSSQASENAKPSRNSPDIWLLWPSWCHASQHPSDPRPEWWQLSPRDGKHMCV